jgi:hypothetical protein
MVSPNDRLRLPPPWITPAAGMPDREVRPVIIVQRRRLLYPAYVQDYLDRVTAADVAAGNTSGLEFGVTDGANTFIQDLVNDGLLGVSGGVISQAASVIKASPIMAGARTRLGAMTPVVGPAPTSFNFVDGDYNRKTGLLGDGSTKYLNSNRNNNADPQNSQHMTVYATALGSPAKGFISTNLGNISGVSQVVYGSNSLLFTRSRSVTGSSSSSISPGLIGISRDNASSYFTRSNNQNTVISVTSDGVQSGTIDVFRRSGEVSDARLAFYSIGESLDLAILDARVTALINAYAAAIP